MDIKAKIGKRNRNNGGLWERIVCKDLESNGLITTKFQGNVQLAGLYFSKESKGEEGLPTIFAGLHVKRVFVDFTPTEDDLVHIMPCLAHHNGNIIKIDKLPTRKSETKIIEGSKVVPAKASRFRLMTTGFPDYIAFMPRSGIKYPTDPDMTRPWDASVLDIIGIECKMGGLLNQFEKEKCRWLLDNHIFSHIFIARKIKDKKSKRISIKYVNFLEYDKKYQSINQNEELLEWQE